MWWEMILNLAWPFPKQRWELVAYISAQNFAAVKTKCKATLSDVLDDQVLDENN